MDNELEIVLNGKFGDEKIMYYVVSDAIANDQYIRWSYCNFEREKIIISIGSNEGETEAKVFTDAKKLEQFLDLLIY